MTQEAMKLALEALEKLWSIIDDIDTYSDMAKADDKSYRTLVERRQRMRFKETGITTDGYKLSGGAITALEEALAQQEQEPIGYLCENAVGHRYFRWKKPPSTYKPIPLYTKENT